MLFGVGRYTVTMELVEAGGLYRTGNVTYRGFEVGRVAAVRLTDTGVQAVLALKSGIDIPSDLKAEVHSHTAIGETYVELLPRNAASPPLKNGDVIALADTSVPPDINDLLSAANTALEAIPHENLQTVIDESYTAVAGLGLELSRLIKGSAELAIDARANLDPLVALIDRAGPVLDSQTHTSDAIAAWAAQLAAVTGQLQTHDSAVGDLIDRGGPALGETRQLLERLQPTVPILLANLVSVGQVALTYHNDIEQLLVVFPMAIAAEQAGILANLNTKQAYRGQYLSFNLNLNLPPPCTTGFLPAQQRRIPTFEDYPDRPAGDLYCRVRTLPVFAAVRISSEFTGNSHLKTRLGHSFARNPGQQGGNTGHAFGVARRVQLSCVHLKGGANRGECIRGDGDFSSVTPGMDCSSAA